MADLKPYKKEVKGNLELMLLLSLIPECWIYRCVLLLLTVVFGAGD